jgi:hypothetical protein
MSQNSGRKFKRGEILFNEGDIISNLYFVSSGRVRLFMPRGAGIDIQNLNAPFVTGELALYSNAKYPFSGMAMTEVTAHEIPIETARQTLESTPQLFKTLSKSLVDQLRAFGTELRNAKVDSDPSPCPPELIPRLFGAMFHTIKHTGKLIDERTIEVDWPTMKKYTNRIFNISLDKIDAVTNILVKFGNAEIKMAKDELDPEAPEHVASVTYRNYQDLEDFFEFYQYYFFKPGKQDILKYDEPIFNMVREMLNLAESTTPDRTGNVKLDLNQLLEKIKKEHNLNVSASHWQMLEAKGLFSKRAQSSDNKFYMMFHLMDFKKTYQAWRFIREIGKWNTQGHVNPKEPEFPVTTNNNQSDAACPECKAPINSQQKFCGECGTKITLSAA